MASCPSLANDRDEAMMGNGRHLRKCGFPKPFIGDAVGTPITDDSSLAEHVLASTLSLWARRTTRRRSAMRRRDVLTLGLLAASIASPALAQDRYPARPVRLVIPSVPAGVHDVIGRVWAEKVKPHFGSIVIDNRGGGGGLIGANDVAHAPPDGYSILLGSTSTHVLLTPAIANPPYDP